MVLVVVFLFVCSCLGVGGFVVVFSLLLFFLGGGGLGLFCVWVFGGSFCFVYFFVDDMF